ncbi:hypothetical protein EGYY_27360 [Eggerthella sp. YY7918]|nr:hypothetical protein EGYY_27360 [Eggerthella sp. YY7918]
MVAAKEGLRPRFIKADMTRGVTGKIEYRKRIAAHGDFVAFANK